MKRIALALLLGLSAFVVQARPAEPSAVAGDARGVTPAAAAGEAQAAAPAEAAKPKLDTGCVRESGTRIKKRDKNGCTGAPGTSYSRADIDRTGAVDTADAIRKLSTSGTVSRGN